MVGYNCFIISQYHYLNIKILKFYENFLKILSFWKKKFNFEISESLIFSENFEIFWNFESFRKFWTLKKMNFIILKILKFYEIFCNLESFEILTFFVYCHEYQITAHPYGVEFHQ